MRLFVIKLFCRKPIAPAIASTLKSLRSFGKKKSEGLKNYSDFLVRTKGLEAKERVIKCHLKVRI